MSKIKIVLFFLLINLPFQVESQNKTFDDVIKADLIKKSEVYKSVLNFNKAQYFFIKKNWDSTLVYSMKQINSGQKKELNDYCHLFRGVCFRELKLFEEAKKEFLLVSKNFEFYNFININLGSIYLELSDFKKAIYYYQLAEKQSQKDPNNCNINVIYENLGLSYLHLNQYSEAEKYLFKTKELKEKEKDTIPLILLYTNIATLYYVQFKDLEAILYYKKAYDLSTKIKDFDKKRLAAKNMAVVEENRGDFKKSLVYRKEFEQWKDSLTNQNKVWAVADFEKKYAIAQKQKEISVLEIENKLKNTQRNNLFYSAVALLILLIVSVFVYGQKVKGAKIIMLQKNKLAEINATKDQLFSIVSHDLKSSVNALKTSNAKLTNSLETKNYQELDQLLHHNSAIANSTYRLLDNLLHWAMLQTKQLYFNKESVHLYSIVQQIEYNYKPLLLDKSIAFENTVLKNCFIFVDLDSLKIILRNMLDNAVKFTPENGRINIYNRELEAGFCQLIIEDTGIGMDQDTINELLKDTELLAKKGNSEFIGTGLGIQLCKKMVKKNNGTFTIESEINRGAKMILSFPKNEQNG
jgi:signal transduction histidine kinase